ncbi:hypothetical protein MB901379_02839 [Mycobacterium basiliense]|uniref:Uncharacterized protein n=1 Tax=Mycobacterium basiliense TaxID=2094119 RepID=A0A3S4BF72_9MYCO|nr:hypothetical protein MB901379_02839 [Mycobacterium basiliense]
MTKDLSAQAYTAAILAAAAASAINHGQWSRALGLRQRIALVR